MCNTSGSYVYNIVNDEIKLQKTTDDFIVAMSRYAHKMKKVRQIFNRSKKNPDNDNDLEKKLRAIADTQKFAEIDDNLSALIKAETDYQTELSCEELNLITAAAGNDFKEFIKFMEEKENG